MGLLSLLFGFRSKPLPNPIADNAIATAIMEKLMGEILYNAEQKIPKTEDSMSVEQLSNFLSYPESEIRMTLQELESKELVDREPNGYQISEPGIQWFIEHGDFDKTK